MFGHDKRVARRQRKLEELLWLDPVERERRIIAAVAAGDFGVEEVDAALRLVMRLDRLRDMDLPAKGRLIGASESRHGAATSSDDVEMGIVESGDDDSGAELPQRELVGIPIVTDSAEVDIRAEYVGVPVMPEARAEAGAEMPLDALESAERWSGHGRRVSPARTRRAAEARAEWSVPVESGQLPPAEEAAPSISWLRPN